MNPKDAMSTEQHMGEIACPTETRTIHFNLKHCKSQDDGLVHANFRSYRLERHTPETLAQASESMPFLKLLPQDQVTHYIKDLPLPSNRPALVTVSMGAKAGDAPVRKTVAMHLHVPRAGMAVARAEMKKRRGGELPAVHPKLAAYGITADAIGPLAEDSDFPDHVDSYNDAMETAIALLFHHPSLLNLSRADGSAVPAFIKEQCITAAIKHDDVLPDTILDCGDDWCKSVPLLDENGKEMRNDKGEIIYTSQLDRDVRDDMKGPLALAIKYSRQEEYLRGHLWSVLDGIVSSEYQGSGGSSFAQRGGKDLDQGSRWQLKNLTPGHGVTVDSNVSYDSGSMTLQVNNSWLRHLGAYIEFVNAKGNPIAPPGDWPAPALPSLFNGTATKKFLTWIGPVGEICGAPIGSDPTSLTFPVPEEASAVNVYLGGIGIFGAGHFDNDVCLLGIMLTAIFEYAVPVFALAAGAAITNSKWFTALLADYKVFLSILAVLAAIDAGVMDYALTGGIKEVLIKVANLVGPLLLKTGLKVELELIAAQGAVEMAIPLVDMAFEALNVAVTASLLGQTTVEVLEAPPVYKTTVTRTIDLDVTLVPDSRYHFFPVQTTHYVVTVTYDSQATVPAKEFPLGSGTHSDPLQVSFKDIPGGGRLKVTAVFYAANGWVAGHGTTAWVDALGTNGSTLVIDKLEVITNVPPLTTHSVYAHLEKLIYNGAHAWSNGAPAPTATMRTSDAALLGLTGITMAQGPASIGYAWQATGLNVPENVRNAPNSQTEMYTVQNVSLLERPEQAYQALDVGYTQKSGICYDLVSKSDGSGINLFIDSYPDAQGSIHLRNVTLSYDKEAKCSPIVSGTGNSYGKFPAGIPLDDFVLHPQGYVFGISGSASKLLRCELARSPVADASAPEACLLSGEGTPEGREGLLLQPVAVAVGLDGVVMVLEGGNARVQAFDIHGNPVKYFNNKTAYILQLHNRGKSMYLDMDVEAKGYVYVLSCINAGTQPSDYFLDIYTPKGDLLVTTSGVAAGKITVSLLRDVYALNYELIRGANGRPEPSISHWIPPAPA